MKKRKAILKKTKCRSGGRPIERALRKMQIPLALPKNCKDLRTIKAKWIKGSHALADIRNDLIHPHKDLVGVSTTDHWKAWHLGQWYFELMLLSRLGYQGCYRNRLANTQRNEESIAPVPWAPQVRRHKATSSPTISSDRLCATSANRHKHFEETFDICHEESVYKL